MVKRCIPWSREEDNIVRRLYPSMSVNELVSKLPLRNSTSIRYRAFVLGVRNGWSDADIKILKEKYSSSTCDELVRMFDGRRTWKSISAKAQGIRLRRVKYTAWTAREISILKKFYPVCTTKEMMKKLPNRTWETIRTKACIFKLRCPRYWMGDENQILRDKYFDAPKDDILKLLPNNNWDAIIAQAGRLGLERNQSFVNSGKRNGFYGKNHSDEVKTLLSKSASLRIGELNPAYVDGSSQFPYAVDFTPAFRRAVRDRDNHTCQICGEVRNDGRRLCVHHIDYDKNHTDVMNSISLCTSCHAKTNFNRVYWQAYFTEVMFFRFSNQSDNRISMTIKPIQVRLA